MKRLSCLFLTLFLFLGAIPFQASALEEAQNISSPSLVTQSTGFPTVDHLFDGNLINHRTAEEISSLTLESEAGFGSLYLIFQYEYGPYTVTDNLTGQSHTFGQERFLHDWLDVEGIFGSCPTSLTLDFSNGQVALVELYAFTSGQTPDFVQKWNAPAEGKTDLLLFSTHGDDEQLFFAGIIPYYSKVLGYEVQVAYLTDHRSYTTKRTHEMLNGLWAVGCRNYPVFGEYADFRIDSLSGTYQRFRSQGVTKDDLLGFCVLQLRRFKPLVVIGHDFNGEYGHGQHMVYAECVSEALELSLDPEQYADTAEIYGTWDVPKAYFHLYKENPIVMDWDTPMEELDGMTPFQVTKELGFPCHVTQQDTWFLSWIRSGAKAADIKAYSPCKFGLFRSTVGEDVEKNDFFENLISYGEQARLEEEARLEAERQKAEEEARLEAERLKAEEEARKAREESIAAEEAARQEAEAKRLAEQQARQKKLTMLLAGLAGLILLLIGILIRLLRRPKRRKKAGKYAKH